MSITSHKNYFSTKTYWIVRETSKFWKELSCFSTILPGRKGVKKIGWDYYFSFKGSLITALSFWLACSSHRQDNLYIRYSSINLFRGNVLLYMYNIYNVCTGLYASLLKGQEHKGISFLVKGTLWGNCKFLLEHFKGTKAMTRGHRGNRLRCLREVSGLYAVYMSIVCLQ